MRQVSDDSLLGILEGFDVSGFTVDTLGGVIIADATPIANPLYQDIYFLVEYNGGDVSNYVAIKYYNGNVITDAVLSYYNGSYNDVAGLDVYFDVSIASIPCLNILVDSVIKDTEWLNGTSVPDNSNNWTLLQNDVFVYVDYIKESVGGTQVLWYQPNAKIASDTLPDRSTADGSQDGAITWGTNSNITVTGGSIMNSISATSVGTTSAMMQSSLFYLGTYTTVYISFEYGLDTNYGYHTSETTANATQSLSVTLTGLTPNSTYHYRAIARNGVVYSYGDDLTFTTTYSTSSVGSTTPLIRDVSVFSGYSATGDLLICAEIVLTYPPYYPTKNPADYFQMQLLDTNGTTQLGAVPIVQWGDRPQAIYLSAATVTAKITYGEPYYIKVVNISSENITVTTSYTLEEEDWEGNDLTRLDDWCIGVATAMQNTDGTILTTPYVQTITDYGIVITEDAGGYFTKGIPNIAQIRPNLFNTAERKFTISELSSSIGYNSGITMSNRVGSTINTDANTVGDVFNITGQQFLLYVILGVILLCIIYTISKSQGFGALGALCLTIPIIGASTYFAILDTVILTMLVVVFLFLFVRQFFWKTM